MSTATQPRPAIGHQVNGMRHQRTDGRDCRCGCQRTIGRVGTVYEVLPILSDGTAYVYVEFPKIEGQSMVQVAYYDHEVTA